MRAIKDVSFVVITYNESFSIRKCLDAYTRLLTENCEVICVDSDSTDGTVDVIREYKDSIVYLQLLQIKNYSNAAVGRNVGLKDRGDTGPAGDRAPGMGSPRRPEGGLRLQRSAGRHPI